MYIYKYAYATSIALFRLLNCFSDICVENMGMMNGKIRDDMLRASSFRDTAHAPQKARLGGSGSWLPARDDVNQYLQIDLLTPHYVTGLTTQGRPAAVSFVRTYRILYSNDGVNWNVYREERGVNKVSCCCRCSVLQLNTLGVTRYMH